MTARIRSYSDKYKYYVTDPRDGFPKEEAQSIETETDSRKTFWQERVNTTIFHTMCSFLSLGRLKSYPIPVAIAVSSLKGLRKRFLSQSFCG